MIKVLVKINVGNSPAVQEFDELPRIGDIVGKYRVTMVYPPRSWGKMRTHHPTIVLKLNKRRQT